MKILLRESKGKFFALDPEDGTALTRIENPGVWCDSSSCKTDGYPDEHAEGIFWDTLEGAKKQLESHVVLVD